MRTVMDIGREMMTSLERGRRSAKRESGAA
jgi:hypothetical protein